MPSPGLRLQTVGTRTACRITTHIQARAMHLIAEAMAFIAMLKRPSQAPIPTQYLVAHQQQVRIYTPSRLLQTVELRPA